jgi:2-dehydropantoate 2-reductase
LEVHLTRDGPTSLGGLWTVVLQKTGARESAGEEAVQRHRVGIVGFGPVGSILGAYLVRSGIEVYGVELAEERAEQVNRDGLLIRGFAQLEERPKHCFSTVAELSEVEDLSIVFVCIKTWALPGFIESFTSPEWPESMRVVATMNGIGPEDLIGDHFPKQRVCRAVINYAGNQDADGITTMNWFHPPNLFGPATERVPERMNEIADLLTQAGLSSLSVNHFEMKKAAFYKTILNSALNALCAAHGLTMARAMHLKHTRRTARVLLREGLTVAGLVGYNYGEDALDRCMEYLKGGGDHYPSMWFDIKERRPTEIEYINGKIVKIGRMFKGVDVSHNLYFTSAIVTQEIKNGTREDDDIPDYLVNG